MRRPVILGSVLLVGALALTGCSAGASSGSEVAPAEPAPGIVAPDQKAAVGGASGSSDSAAVAGSKQPATDRSIVVTGQMTITADDPLKASASAVKLVEDGGGRIDGRAETAGADGAPGTATLTLRIPAARLDGIIDALKKLGRADQVSIDSSDVTTQSQDLDARITALRTTIQRLLELEQKAAATDDLISIETAVGDRQGELEGLEAQQRGLADQVAMSTITLTLQAKQNTPPPARGSFLDGLEAGWNAFTGFWQGFLVVIGVLLPWLVLAAVIGVAAWLVSRARLRALRRRAG